MQYAVVARRRGRSKAVVVLALLAQIGLAFLCWFSYSRKLRPLILAFYSLLSFLWWHVSPIPLLKQQLSLPGAYFSRPAPLTRAHRCFFRCHRSRQDFAAASRKRR